MIEIKILFIHNHSKNKRNIFQRKHFQYQFIHKIYLKTTLCTKFSIITIKAIPNIIETPTTHHKYNPKN